MITIEYSEGATPLDPEETEGLLLTHITTRGELDRWEQDNILDAVAWLESTKPKDILNETFIRTLHNRMFRDVWKWAGRFRQRDKNLGVSWWRVPMDLRGLCDDVEWWVQHQVYSSDEMAVRFHHRLVSIHAFPNGNGRHARLMADLLLENILQRARFSWGRQDLSKASDARRRYLDALQAAGKSEYAPLIDFARS